MNIMINNGQPLPFARYIPRLGKGSAILVVIGLIWISVFGLNFGLEFTGGIEMEVKFTDASIHSELAEVFPDAKIVKKGSDQTLITLAGSSNEHMVQMTETVKKFTDRYQQDFQVIRIDAIGPQVGGELTEQGGLGILIALIMILIYVAFRFQLKFGVAAITALFHDVVLSLFFASVTQLEIDMSVIAAVLALIGYSLNDTIVVSDRIRENAVAHLDMPLEKVFDKSYNQILGRTVITSMTTLLVISSLILFGGESLRSFSWLLGFGVLVGTYSSIAILGATLLALKLTTVQLKPEEDEEEFE